MAAPEWIMKLIEKGGDANECMQLLKEINQAQDKAAERDERKAERELEKAKVEKEIKMKELEIKEKEIALSTASSKEKSKIKPKVLLPKFLEGEDIEVFLRSFEKLANSYGWEKTEWAIRLVPQLSGKALEAYSRMAVGSSNDYDLVKQAILERYGLNALAYRDKFRYARQDRSENYKEYAIRVENYLKHWVQPEKAESNYVKLYDLMLREQLMFTAPQDLQIWLKERSPHTFKDLVEMAETYQLAHKQSGASQQQQRSFNTGTRTTGISPANPSKSGQTDLNTGASLTSNNPAGMTQSSQYLKGTQNQDGVRRCYFCGSPDHLISNCTDKKSKEGKNRPAKTNEENPFSHTTALLLSPKKTEVNSYKVRVPLIPEVKSEDVQELDNGLKFVKGYINGVEAWVLRDTGCTTICVSKEFAKNIDIESKAERIIRLANGSECLCHEVEIDISSPYLSGRVVALTMECPFADVIVGETAFLKASEEEKQFDHEVRDSEVRDSTIDHVQVGAYPEVIKSDMIVGGVSTRAMRKFTEQQEKQGKLVEEKFLKEKENKIDKAGIAYTMYDMEGKESLKQDQREDKTLDKVRELANVCADEKEETHFLIKDDVLYRQYVRSNGEILHQIVVPKKHRYQIMHTAHDRPFGGHLGNKKTRERILNHFYWPGIFPDVAKFCKSCVNCQKCIPKGRVPKAPLIPIQPMDEPFKRIAIDIVGPLNRTKRGNKYILVICDYATKYPEAIPLKYIDSESVANALIDTFSRVGFPGELLSDQGTNFMSSLMEQLCKLLQIRKMNTTPYHPQMVLWKISMAL